MRGIQCQCNIHLKTLTQGPVYHIEILFLKYFFCFPDANIPFTLHTWIGTIDTEATAKEEQICPSVSIQKIAFKFVLWYPKWKKKNIEDCQFWLKPLIDKANRPWRCDKERVVEMGELTSQNSPVGGREGGGYLGEIVISVCTILAGCEVCGNLA